MERKPDDLDRTSEPEIPQELGRDLARLYGRGVAVPGEADARILARARSRFAKRTRRTAWWLGAAASAAAAIVLACVLVTTLRGPEPERLASTIAASEAVARPEDFDRNGTVNIVDAMLLARRLEGSARRETSWDVNGDGAVDRADVDAIAMIAVSLKEG
jgi:hypothetical protein